MKPAPICVAHSHRSIFRIAQSLTQKKDLSDEDKKTAVTLIQQAINEGKAAVALNQTDSINWNALAVVYENLIGAAQQADQWTVAAYTQAIIRDPANPKLRVDLGGVYRKLKSDDQASRLFEQAAQLKPDYANAYFNMASIAETLNHKDQQLALLKKTLSLMDTKDPQYNQMKEIVEKLDKEVAAMAPKDNKSATPSATPKATPAATTSANLRETFWPVRVQSQRSNYQAMQESPARQLQFHQCHHRHRLQHHKQWNNIKNYLIPHRIGGGFFFISLLSRDGNSRRILARLC